MQVWCIIEAFHLVGKGILRSIVRQLIIIQDCGHSIYSMHLKLAILLWYLLCAYFFTRNVSIKMLYQHTARVILRYGCEQLLLLLLQHEYVRKSLSFDINIHSNDSRNQAIEYSIWCFCDFLYRLSRLESFKLHTEYCSQSCRTGRVSH